MIKWASRSSFGRERVSSHILRRDYVKKLEPIKIEAEDLESLKDLNALCTLVHSILMLNDAAIYEYCLQDDIVLIVASILDYDPEFGNQKASYHSDLSDQTRFKQVVPIKDPTITSKIHQTYRLQYFKDIILARILDDSTFSIINSMIFFNQIDIVQYLHSNDEFMRELFGIFDERVIPAAANLSPVIGPPLPPSMLVNTTSDSIEPPSIERKIDGILFIQQLCGMAKHLQPSNRIGFFRSLAERGVLKVIEFGLSKKPVPADQQNQTTATDQEDPLDDLAIKSAICEILITIIDYDPNSVRGYCLKQDEQKTRNLMECLIDLLLIETDLGLKVQLSEAIRTLVDTGAGAGGGGMQMQGGPDLMRRDEDPEHEKFLHTKYAVLESTLAAKVGSILLFDRYKFVQLSALRFFRACLMKSDDVWNRRYIQYDLYIPVLDLLDRQGSKDNLLSSACLEFFENIRLKNAKPVLDHLMKRDGTRIKQLSEKLVTFKSLIARWEMNNEPPPLAPSSIDSLHPLRNIGSWSRTRTLDAEEESYFNHDSDEESDEDHQKQESQISKMAITSVQPIAIPTIPGTLVKPIGLAGSASESGSSSGRKRHRSGSFVSEDGSPQLRTGGLTRSRTHSGPFSTGNSSSNISQSGETETPAVVCEPLVDYDDDNEDEAEAEREKPEPPKRRKNDEDEEDEGVFGRLKRGSTPMIRSSGGCGNVGFTFPTASLTSTTTTSPSSGNSGKSATSKIVLSFGKNSGSGSSGNTAEN
ncbi:component of IIS longevity pathway SMK-1-domain-containing protein [Melampsora americana]|nr:component of IIS longevity pathway SMK-1-domain-containing protein [Melampsora americana]